ncbi:MAG: DinB family protein [Bacteroidetes bacterium]|jgi:uncharacterized damage-inducible protein DinB|nr:DinB family protein [Bacteroidota bacterium]MDF1864978.1 DinB family protein [Saprospiraceae bacterium]
MTHTKKRPEANEYWDYYQTYTNKVEGNDALKTLTDAKSKTIAFLKNLSEKQWNYRYTDNKWSIKEVLLHIIDTERIFAYRALRIARNDKTPLMGFEQDDYIQYNYADNRSSESIIEEYESVRNATLTLFQSMNDESLAFSGTASENPATARALMFIMAGHEIHHLNILKERYL